MISCRKTQEVEELVCLYWLTVGVWVGTQHSPQQVDLLTMPLWFKTVVLFAKT